MTEHTFLHHIKKNEQKLFRFAYRILKDVAKAEDAVQDLVVKLWNKRERLNELGNPDVYFMVAIKHHCLDEIRKTNRRRIHHENHSTQEQKISSNPENQAVQKDVFQQVRILIKDLPETQKMVIQLRDIEQLEMEEIQEITGLNAGAIRTNLSRARKTIREKMRKIINYGLE